MTMDSPRLNPYQGQIAKAVEDFRFNTGNPIYYLLAPRMTPAQDCSLILNKDDSVFGIAIYNIGSEGKHLVYPISRVQTIAKSVINSNTSIAYGWLGATGRDVLSNVPTRLNREQLLPELGVRIMAIAPDSPAEKAGLKALDVVVAVNDHKVDTQAQMVTLMKQLPSDNEIALKVKRDKEYITIKAKLIPAPATEPEQQLAAFTRELRGIEKELAALPMNAPNRLSLENRQKGWEKFIDDMIHRVAAPDIRMRVLFGLEVQPLTGQLMNYFAVPNGLLVTTVTEKEKAARAGLQAGDVIMKVGEKSISKLTDLSGALDNSIGQPIELVISRRHEQMKLSLPR
jgi:S1-C subfamily serine protease